MGEEQPIMQLIIVGPSRAGVCSNLFVLGGSRSLDAGRNIVVQSGRWIHQQLQFAYWLAADWLH